MINIFMALMGNIAVSLLVVCGTIVATKRDKKHFLIHIMLPHLMVVFLMVCTVLSTVLYHGDCLSLDILPLVGIFSFIMALLTIVVFDIMEVL